MTEKQLTRWIVVVIMQVVGAIVPTFANVHSNVFPALASVLLLPGIVIQLVVDTSWLLTVSMAISINVGFYYFLFRRLGKA